LFYYLSKTPKWTVSFRLLLLTVLVFMCVPSQNVFKFSLPRRCFSVLQKMIKGKILIFE